VTIRLPGQVRDAIETHAANCAPQECCGLLATDPIGEVRFVYPLTNADRSETSFTIDERESYGAFVHADRHGWSISGVFHSHPAGPNHLSDRDLFENADQRWIHLVVSPAGLRGFRVESGVPVEVDVV
jgi:proteasome lid subunit RPN8/RPN11